MALTQIHGNRQVLDGTIKDAEIAADAAILSSKLNLSNVDLNAQVVRFASTLDGKAVQLEGTADVLRVREADISPQFGSWRIRMAGGGVNFDFNTAVAGDFSTFDTIWGFNNGSLSVLKDLFANAKLQVGGALRVENAAPELVLRETDQVLPAGLWRSRAHLGELIIERNTAAAGDFSTLVPMMTFRIGEVLIHQSAIVGSVLTLDGSQGTAFLHFGGSANPVFVPPVSLFKSPADNRLHVKAIGGVDQTLAYLSDITTVTTPDIHEGGVKITGLATPGTPTVTPQGAPGTTAWGYKMTAVGVNGETVASLEGTTTTGNAVLSATNFNRVSWAAVAGAVSYNVYRTTAGGTPNTLGKVGNTTATTFDDIGLAASGAVPTEDTSDIVWVESKTPALLLRDTDEAGAVGTYRLRTEGGSLRLDNVDPNNLASFTEVLRVQVGNDILLNQRLLTNGIVRFMTPRAQGSPGTTESSTLYLRSAVPTRLVFHDSADVENLLAYKVDDTKQLESLAPDLVLKETDQTLPAGLWRLRLDADQLTLEKNTAASGDFSTADVPLRLFGTNVIVVRTERFQMSNTAIQFTEYTGLAHGNILYRDGVGFLKFNNSSGQSRRVLFHESVVMRETPTGAVNGINTAFTLAAVPLDNSEQVYLNGILQSPGATEDYTITSGTITFNNPPQTGDKIRVTYIKSTL